MSEGHLVRLIFFVSAAWVCHKYLDYLFGVYTNRTL